MRRPWDPERPSVYGSKPSGQNDVSVIRSIPDDINGGYLNDEVLNVHKYATVPLTISRNRAM